MIPHIGVDIITIQLHYMRTNLFLILKKEYFDQITQGVKTEEYRQVTDYWQRRLLNRKYNKIIFQLGYQKGAPRIQSDWSGYDIKEVIHPFFNNKKTEVFAIKLSNVVYLG